MHESSTALRALDLAVATGGSVAGTFGPFRPDDRVDSLTMSLSLPGGGTPTLGLTLELYVLVVSPQDVVAAARAGMPLTGPDGVRVALPGLVSLDGLTSIGVSGNVVVPVSYTFTVPERYLSYVISQSTGETLSGSVWVSLARNRKSERV